MCSYTYICVCVCMHIIVCTIIFVNLSVTVPIEIIGDNSSTSRGISTGAIKINGTKVCLFVSINIIIVREGLEIH